jgi:hypothetical protein
MKMTGRELKIAILLESESDVYNRCYPLCHLLLKSNLFRKRENF